MPRTIAAAVLLAVLALMLPGKAVAGPPERVSGKMVLAPDEVADGLNRFRRERDVYKRVLLLCRLAETKDPRVLVAVGKSLSDHSTFLYEQRDFSWGFPGQLVTVEESMDRMAASILNMYYPPPGVPKDLPALREWWDKNEADLRRRAKQLPQ